ncbi:MAG: 50S ribosomal protein L15e [Nanoarchaeota archaeon]|nr:50S ribosomal protein L15e [Nanoarchaeota archaeon]
MGVYKFLSKLWKNPKRDNPNYKDHLIKWRREGSLVRVEKPVRLDRARSVGYKAKSGVVVIRSRITKGGRKRESTHQGRKPGSAGKVKYSTKKNLQTIAEARCTKKYPNLRVVNSYEVGDDGKYTWFEVIMIDCGNPQIFNDKHYALLCTDKHRRRVFRGLTSAGKKGRGLRNKGKGAEKIRPSIRANKTRGK